MPYLFSRYFYQYKYQNNCNLRKSHVLVCLHLPLFVFKWFHMTSINYNTYIDFKYRFFNASSSLYCSVLIILTPNRNGQPGHHLGYNPISNRFSTINNTKNHITCSSSLQMWYSRIRIECEENNYFLPFLDKYVYDIIKS